MTARSVAGALSVSLVGDADRAAWDAFLASAPEGDPLQCWAWGDAVAPTGERPIRLAVRDGTDSILGIAQVLARPTRFGRQVLYAPHGPVWRRDGPEAAGVLARLLEGLRDLGRAERAIVVKVDPRADLPHRPVGSPPAGGGPEVSAAPGDPVARALLAAGLRRARRDLQAGSTRLVDLAVGWEALFAGLPKDTRNLVRRAEREGVQVTVDRSPDGAAIAAFHALYAVTAARGGFRPRSLPFLQALAAGLAADRGCYLVMAHLADRPIAGMVIARVGDRAHYLYGGSIREEAVRHANGPYAAMATALRALSEDSVGWFDLWGVVEPEASEAGGDWAGFSAFKRRFGGQPIRHPGTFDLVIDPAWYLVRDARERLAARLSRRRTQSPPMESR